MPENSTKTVLQLRFRLRVPPHRFLADSRESAAIISSVEGLIWKIWIFQEDFQVGGIYLFASREAAEAYLNCPVVQAAQSNPAVLSTQCELWDVEGSLSALTRIPLPGIAVPSSEAETLLTGGQ